jgi:glycosyltransferase involved in cell wall biosynthesis
MSLRLALISQPFSHLKPGGVPTYVNGRQKYLSRNIEVKVFAIGTPLNESNQISLGQNLNGGILRFLPVWIKLIQELWKWKPDIIEVHNIPTGLPLFFFINSINYFFHGPAHLEAKSEGKHWISCTCKYLLEKIFLVRSKKIFVASKNFRELIKIEHPILKRLDKKVIVKYPKLSIDTEKKITLSNFLEVKRLQSLKTGAKFICVRRLVSRTGVDLLINAFSHAVDHKKIPVNSILLIIGNGPLEGRINELICKNKYAHNIRMLGTITNEYRDELYRNCDFNIVPTIGLEGFGLVVIEAAFQGCPSIVTNINALPEVIEMLNGKGFICQPNIISLSNMLEFACKSPKIDRFDLKQEAIFKFMA